MDEIKDIEALPIPATNTMASEPAKDHDVSSKSSGDAKAAVPETDYSGKSENKTSFMHYLVMLPSVVPARSEL